MTLFKEPDRRRIFLLRHGEAAYIDAEGRVTDDPRTVPLTPTGQIQARKQAAVLASVTFDKAICSGLARTRETAKLVLAHRDHPPLDVVPELEEIRGGGRPLEVSDMKVWLGHVANPWAGADQPEAKFLGGERFVDFADRTIPAFDAIIADQSWRTLLLVLHGAVNRMIFNHVIGVPWRGQTSIEQDNCCINVIDVDGASDGSAERYLIRVVNLTSYDLNKSSMHLTTMEQAAKRIATDLEAAGS